MTHRIGIIGYGNMAKALHQGWVSSGFDASYTVISPSQQPRQDGNTHYFNDPNDSVFQGQIGSCDLLMMAVKPQIMGGVCQTYAPMIAQSTAILSIAAGLTIPFFEDLFPSNQPIIRAMPNTPSLYRKGVTGYVCNSHCTPDQASLADALFQCSGHAYDLGHESLIDPLSAVSGSGPAYVFYIVEALTKAGIDNGLDDQMAAQLARQTFIGAAAMLEHESTDPAILRRNVTSPRGTTEAALNRIMDGNIQSALTEGLSAAIQRAKELSNS